MKKSKESGMEKARAKLAALEGRGKGSELLEIKAGEHEYRFWGVPGAEDNTFADLLFAIEDTSHWIGSQSYTCLTTSWGGKNENIPSATTECPACRMLNKLVYRSNKLHPRNSEESKASYGSIMREWGAWLSYFGYANYAEDLDADEVPQPMPVRLNKDLFRDLMRGAAGKAKCRFYEFGKKARIISITATKKMKDKNWYAYAPMFTNVRSNFWTVRKDIIANMPDLTTYMSKKVTPEQMQRIIDDSSVEYEDEKPKTEPKKKSRFEREEEADDDEDKDKDDDEADDDGDEEEREPPKRKTSPAVEKQKKRLKAAAGEEDDEDEDDEDESEDEEDADDDEKEERKPAAKSKGVKKSRFERPEEDDDE